VDPSLKPLKIKEANAATLDGDQALLPQDLSLLIDALSGCAYKIGHVSVAQRLK
jgi:hypothetical protein